MRQKLDKWMVCEQDYLPLPSHATWHWQVSSIMANCMLTPIPKFTDVGYVRIAFVILSALLGAAGWAGAADNFSRPNIVLIMADDQG